MRSVMTAGAALDRDHVAGYNCSFVPVDNPRSFDEIPTTSEGFYLQLINTKSYYDRFGSVNEARLKQGYKALDEKTIVGMEDEYDSCYPVTERTDWCGEFTRKVN